jgi:hypothetical protein
MLSFLSNCKLVALDGFTAVTTKKGTIWKPDTEKVLLHNAEHILLVHEWSFMRQITLLLMQM